MRTLGSVKPVFVVLTGLLLLSSCTIENGRWGSRAKYERTVEMEHPLAAGSALTVATASGSIAVTGQPVETCRFVATIEARAPSEEEAAELAEEVELRFVESGSGLAIRADRPPTQRRQSISISYEIVVPHQTSVDCSSASGSVSAADLQGDVRAHTASGSVRAERVSGGDVHLDSASGQVRLADASGVPPPVRSEPSVSKHNRSRWTRPAEASRRPTLARGRSRYTPVAAPLRPARSIAPAFGPNPAAAA
jgi:hypothetical protein